MADRGNNREDRKDAATNQKTHRTFIAVSVPAHVTDSLRGLQQKLKDFGVRMKYTDPENIHLTLKFLGDVRASRVAAIEAQLADTVAGYAPLRLSAGGLGVFPGIRRPRVLWTGIAGQTDHLEQLQHDVESAMEAIGFQGEGRRFTGHLTLGRFKGKTDADRLADAIREFGDFASEEFVVEALHLFESTLTPRGPVYRKFSSHRLGASTRPIRRN